MPKSFYACLSAVLVLVMLAFAYGEADAARILYMITTKYPFESSAVT